MAIDYDFVTPAEVTGYIREVPVPPELSLNGILPDRTFADIEVAWDIVTRTNRAAKFRSWDAPTTVGKRDSLARDRISMPPLGQKTMIGEQERIMLERVRSGGTNRDRVVEAIYNEAEINTSAVHNRMELARGGTLTTGTFTTTMDDGLGLSADFGVALSQFVTASVLWSDHANSDPIQDLITWCDAYETRCGVRPGKATMARATVGHLLRNDSIRSYFANLNGTPTIITAPQLQQLLDAHELPMINVYNAQIEVDGVATRPIPADKVILTPPDPATLGFTAWGLTVSAMELFQGGNPGLLFAQLPGLFGTVIRETDPYRLWTNVDATGMPMITDPRRLTVATVL